MTEGVSPGDASSRPTIRGMVHVFTGDGKGKTTAAVGAVVRAIGQGKRAYVVFFMKGDYPYGERNILTQLPNVDIVGFGSLEFVDPANVKPEEKEQAELALSAAHEAMLSGRYDMVVLDEVNVAVAWKLVPVEEVIRFIRDKPPNVELILTGRKADIELIRLADLVTECLKIKHPYDKGVKPRRGIEY